MFMFHIQYVKCISHSKLKSLISETNNHLGVRENRNRRAGARSARAVSVL